MSDSFNPYVNLAVFIPSAMIFVILFSIIRQTIGQMPPPLAGGPKNVMAFCVTALAMLGMDRMIIRAIVIPYGAMGIAILFVLAIMLVMLWIAARRGSREKRVRSSDRKA